jgi:hypothetical protein
MRVLACACLILVGGCFLSGYEERTFGRDAEASPVAMDDAAGSKLLVDGGAVVAKDAAPPSSFDSAVFGMDATVIPTTRDAGPDARVIRPWEEWWEAWKNRDAGPRDAALADAGGPSDAAAADAEGGASDAGDAEVADAAIPRDAEVVPCIGPFCAEKSQACTTQNCDLECPVGGSGSRPPDSCWLDCADAEICETTCHVYESCLTECQGTTCQANCAQESSCGMFCDEAHCKGVCEPGATCAFFCLNSTCNQFKCKEGAQCTLVCLNSTCDFQECAGQKKACPDGTIVCNRDCPANNGNGNGNNGNNGNNGKP